MIPTIVPAYTAVLALIFIVLAVRVIRLRQRNHVTIGHGDDAEVERMMRVHANFAEYVPLALLLILFAEMQGRPAWLVNVFCVVLIAGRLVHAYGVSQVKEDIRLRVAGMAATFAVLIAAAVSALTQFII